jgi:hypothetical protein
MINSSVLKTELHETEVVNLTAAVKELTAMLSKGKS